MRVLRRRWRVCCVCAQTGPVWRWQLWRAAEPSVSGLTRTVGWLQRQSGVAWLLAALGAALVGNSLLLLLGRGLSSFGVSFPLVVGALMLAWARWRPRCLRWLHARPRCLRLWRVFQLGLALWLLSLLVFFVLLHRAQHEASELQAPVRAVIVLGSGTPGGKPSLPLQARLDAAHEVANRFADAVVLVSGGVDFGETLSEGAVMGNYLREQGMDASRIVQEEASTSTELNLKLSQPLLAARGVQLADPVVVVTSDFHVWRAARIAARQGWKNVQTVGAPMPLYMRYNAWLREYFAVGSSWLLREM